MAFWNKKPVLQTGPVIPEVLPKVGREADHGGPANTVQYRVWAKTIDGKRVLWVDPEFQGALIAWRQFNSKLDYYVDVALPTGVVWDTGRKAYVEVDLDTMENYRRLNSPEWMEAERQRKAEEAADQLAAETAEKEKKEYEATHAKPFDTLMGELGPDALAPLGKAKGSKRRGRNPMRRRNPSIVNIEPQNKAAYEYLRDHVAADEWQWMKVGNLMWRYQLAIDGRYLDDLVDELEADGWIFKKREGQKPGVPDFIAYFAE